jgi:hypothetical protein
VIRIPGSILLLAPLLTASAQILVQPETLPDRWKTFQRASDETKLDCRIEPVRPRLSLSFRFQTGYTVEVPMRQYSGAGHWWSLIVRVSPELAERDPAWLAARVRIPTVPDTKAIAEVSGGYIVGEGRYRVQMMLVDDRDRTCTAEWSIRAKMSDEAREVRPGLPPGAVDDLTMRRWRIRPLEQQERRYNVSVLLHASAVTPNRMILGDYDRMLLVSAMSSLVERLPANIRLTVFSMDRQKEIYHSDHLTNASLDDLVESLNELELGTIDYATLQNRTGHLDLLSGLLNREMAGSNPPDAVIILGPLAHSEARVPPEMLQASRTGVPVYYVQLRPWRMLGAYGADTISYAVKLLGGRTKQVYSPEDLAEAIRDIERLLSRGGESPAALSD